MVVRRHKQGIYDEYNRQEGHVTYGQDIFFLSRFGAWVNPADPLAADDGSFETPFLTIQGAVDAVEDIGPQYGIDTVIIQSGTYDETVIIRNDHVNLVGVGEVIIAPTTGPSLVLSNATEASIATLIAMPGANWDANVGILTADPNVVLPRTNSFENLKLYPQAADTYALAILGAGDGTEFGQEASDDEKKGFQFLNLDMFNSANEFPFFAWLTNYTTFTQCTGIGDGVDGGYIKNCANFQIVDCGNYATDGVATPSSEFAISTTYDSALDEPNRGNLGHLIERSSLDRVNVNDESILTIENSSISSFSPFQGSSVSTIVESYFGSLAGIEFSDTAQGSIRGCFIMGDLDLNDTANVTADHVFIGDDLELIGGGAVFEGDHVFIKGNIFAASGAGTCVLYQSAYFGTFTDPDGKIELHESSQQELTVTEGPNSTGVRMPFRATAAPYIILDTDGVYTVFGTGGAGGILVTLPTAVNNPGRVIAVKKVDVGVGAVDISAAAGDSVEGNVSPAPLSLGVQYDSVILQSDGVLDWYVLGDVP
jgi:hypothetical protein